MCVHVCMCTCMCVYVHVYLCMCVCMDVCVARYMIIFCKYSMGLNRCKVFSLHIINSLLFVLFMVFILIPEFHHRPVHFWVC